MAALINTIQINYYKQQYQRTQRTNQVRAYSEVRSVVSQPKCHQIQLFSWILDDGRAPVTGIWRVNLEPADGNISPVSVRSALFKVAGYPGNFSRRGSARAALSNRNARARIGEPAVTQRDRRAGADPSWAVGCRAGPENGASRLGGHCEPLVGARRPDAKTMLAVENPAQSTTHSIVMPADFAQRHGLSGPCPFE